MTCLPSASGVVQARRMKSSMPGSARVGQLLFGHPLRLDAEEPVEQPRDVGLGRGEMIAIAGQGLQLALLALQAPAK
jgi:hypothetical protein